MNRRIERLRERVIGERASIDISRARIVTLVHKERAGEPLVAVWGHAMYRLFAELPIAIPPGELLVGSPTVRPRAAQLFPEVQSAWLDDELDCVDTRAWDPLEISPDDKREVREVILPYWKGRTIAERLYAQCPTDTAQLIYLQPGVWPTKSTGIIDNYSLIQKGIGTVVPNYSKVLELGVNGIIRQIDEQRHRLDLTVPSNVSRMVFLDSAKRALQGVVVFAERYAQHALELSHYV